MSEVVRVHNPEKGVAQVKYFSIFSSAALFDLFCGLVSPFMIQLFSTLREDFTVEGECRASVHLPITSVPPPPGAHHHSGVGPYGILYGLSNCQVISISHPPCFRLLQSVCFPPACYEVPERGAPPHPVPPPWGPTPRWRGTSAPRSCAPWPAGTPARQQPLSDGPSLPCPPGEGVGGLCRIFRRPASLPPFSR